MTDQEASIVRRLCEAKNPRDLDDWEGQDGYYVTACRAFAEDVPGLIDIVRKWVDPRWPDEAASALTDQDAELLPVTAWRTMADLKADAAVEPLIDLLCALDDESDDWASEDLPHVFGKIGESAIEPRSTSLRTTAIRNSFGRLRRGGLRCVADCHPDTRNRIVACLTEMLANPVHDDIDFNTTLMAELVELHAIEAAEPIERAFAANLLDGGTIGDWEAVRLQLGVEGLGLAMPEHPHKSVEQLRRQIDYGIFSDRQIFSPDGLEDKAADAYIERAFETFSRSTEAQQVIEQYGDLQWFQALLEFGLNYLGETIDEMTPDSVAEFVLDYVPRKVSTDAESAASIVGELSMFWKYLDRVYKLPAAKEVVEWLETDGRIAQLESDLSDPSNFGMAKSIFMLGKNAGYDMTSKASMTQFIAAYNRSLSSPQASPGPVAKNERVGRNAPCPCGSGKKFKKCCGPSSQHD
ncbi:MAG TPA: SEC-C metal-binding domain-containing protein [Pirellulales bacterium]|nr:SEC-C metal-binding domain-containing protein [Pirellulales bacterium]